MKDHDYRAKREALRASIPAGGLKLEPGDAGYAMWEICLRTPGTKPARETVKKEAR